jgi:1,4-alpha-glucan branching enzyme
MNTSYDSAITYDHIAEVEGLHWIKVVADNAEFNVSDSIYYFIRGELTIADIPAGMGNGVNIVDDNTVTVVLFAPNKNNVLLIGDFNNWELSNDFLMIQTPDGESYWITLNNLTSGEEYGYQFLIDGTIRVADAYTQMVLDPNNDVFIPTETYPGLKPYPEGKTTGLVSVFQTAPPDYEWQTGSFTPPALTDLVIYEMHVQNFTSAGNIKSLTDTLDYLDELGVNAIELMPINEFEGNYSWGYNPSFYFALDKMYGTKNDFKAFVDACHTRGIAVIIDMVLNHSYSQSPLLTMYRNSTTGKPSADNPWYNENHNFVDNTSAHWGFDFNHESEATQDLVDSINSFWMSEYRVDGFRFDFTKGFSNTLWYGSDNWASAYDAERIAILKRMADEIWLRNENAYIIFEHLADNSEETELVNHGILLWGNMNYNYNEATMGYHENNKSNFSWGAYTSRGWTEPHLVTYMESHDEERLMYKNITWGNSNGNYDIKNISTALQRIEAAAAFFLTIPGPKMLWQWGELGYHYSINRCVDGTIDPGCRLALKPLGWVLYEDPNNYRLYRVFSELIKLRIENDLFETIDFSLDVATPLKKIHLNSTGMNATILGNFDLLQDNIVPAFQHTGVWYDYLSGESIEVNDVNASIELPPGAYKIYTDIELETPDIPPVTITYPLIEKNPGVCVYPNPVSDEINILTSATGNMLLEIFHLSGQLVHKSHFYAESNIPQLINQTLSPGIYIYKIFTPESSIQGKLVIE